MGSGYGTMYFNGKKQGAHRLSYEFFNGDFDKSLYVCHHCDNKICVRPDHLFLGTQSDNMRDCSKKGRLKNAYRWTSENNPNTGKPFPDHLKKQMSERKQRPFKCLSPSGEIVHQNNLTQFCKEHGLNQGAMWLVCKGRKRSHKGYKPIQ